MNSFFEKRLFVRVCHTRQSPGAQNVSVNIKTYGFKNRTRIEIINDGVIHDAKHKFDRGIGLMSIEERVSELNGRCKITISHLFKIIIELGAKK